MEVRTGRTAVLVAVVVFVTAGLLAAGPARAEDVSGHLPPGQTVWSGTIRVIDNVIVPVGSELVIQPGTLVQFDNPWRVLSVDGQLDAQGIAVAPITFTSVTDDAPGQWGGVLMNPGSTGTFAHATFRYGGYAQPGMLVVDDASVTVLNCAFSATSASDSLGAGIFRTSECSDGIMRNMR